MSSYMLTSLSDVLFPGLWLMMEPNMVNFGGGGADLHLWWSNLKVKIFPDTDTVSIRIQWLVAHVWCIDHIQMKKNIKMKINPCLFSPVKWVNYHSLHFFCTQIGVFACQQTLNNSTFQKGFSIKNRIFFFFYFSSHWIALKWLDRK